MSVFERDMFDAELADSGVRISDFGAALTIWVAMQDATEVTVADAAKAFNTTHAVIREAINEATWAYLSGPDDMPDRQFIELDGE